MNLRNVTLFTKYNARSRHKTVSSILYVSRVNDFAGIEQEEDCGPEMIEKTNNGEKKKAWKMERK